VKHYLLLILVSCSWAPIPHDVSDEPENLPLPPAISKQEVEVVVRELKWFSAIAGAEERFRKIAANTQKVINSKAFEHRVRNHRYLGDLQFVDTTDTPDEVYEKITSSNWNLEYHLVKMRLGSSVVAYTNTNDNWIAFNSRKWLTLSDADIASNICHEYGGHKLGKYTHAKVWSKARDFSAPYGIGTACESVYREMFP
jgi:hypothetical protein